jgi:hypothetical protein
MSKKVFGFWHILMINHYFEIISEQLQIMVDSGLYDECDNIYVGVLGNNDGLKEVQELFMDYPKIIIAEYSTNKENFEFHTLKILKRKADESKTFYGFYIHTKGVSWKKVDENFVATSSIKNAIPPQQAYTGGRHWCDYMNYYTLFRWRDNVVELNKGYETCGTQLRPKRTFEMHYSGTFAWFNSDYIKIVKNIETLNKKDRFSAEMWMCSSLPIAATLCQNFVDYNTKGIFNPSEKKEATPIKMIEIKEGKKEVERKKNRNIVFTLAFNLVSETENATRLLYEQNDKNDFEHYIIDLGFPLLKGDEIPDNIDGAKKINTETLKKLASDYGSVYLKMDNVGVSQNHGTFYKHIKPDDTDVFITCEPDEIQQEGGWVKALADTLRADKTLGYVATILVDAIPILKDNDLCPIEIIANNNVYIMNGMINYGQIATSGKFINLMGGMPYPKAMPVYGGIEFALKEHLDKHKLRWGILKDYSEVHTNVPILLRQWKDAIIFGEFKDSQIGFEDWLNIQKQKR